MSEIQFDERGLAPAIVQDARTGEVLTLAWMNEESLGKTRETSQTWFWSRSRKELWNKGATSGNTQQVVALGADCDSDAIVVQVIPAGPACHTGEDSCFFEEVAGFHTVRSPGNRLGGALSVVERVVAQRKIDMPEGSYTTYLFSEGIDKILKKVGEEASEVIIASKNDDDEELAGEIADLLYHLTVLMAERGLSSDAVAARLEERRKG
jgi:phosphoribosyl-ATP pyrophosphohydrolase/phosphoribosyl-AMP cyclohydrolase